MEIDNTFLRRLFQDKASEIHGRILRQYDSLDELGNTLSDKQKLEVIKKFSLDLIHQELRNLRNSIVFASEGRKYTSIKVSNPDSKE